MIVAINRLTAPAGYGDRMARMFRERAAFSHAPGFIDFAFLRAETNDTAPDREQFVVLMRWADHASFDAWTASDEFSRAHSGMSERSPVSSTLETYEVLFEERASPAPS